MTPAASDPLVRSLRRRSVVALANEVVPILVVCRLIGMGLPAEMSYGRAPKVYCPFGPLYHADAGHEAAFRVYVDSNSCYCFAGCGYFSPVWLAAQAWDVDSRSAATELLERTGYASPTLSAAWEAAQAYQPAPDPVLLRQALQTYCTRICPDWAAVQFTTPVAATLSRCLDLLSRVQTGEDARRWLVAVKMVMRRALRVVPGPSGHPVVS